jgi:hypothetical protein
VGLGEEIATAGEVFPVEELVFFQAMNSFEIALVCLGASGRHPQHGLRAAPGGSVQCRGNSAVTRKAAKGSGKDGGYATLENAARSQLFPQPRRRRGLYLDLKSGHFTCLRQKFHFLSMLSQESLGSLA